MLSVAQGSQRCPQASRPAALLKQQPPRSLAALTAAPTRRPAPARLRRPHPCRRRRGWRGTRRPRRCRPPARSSRHSRMPRATAPSPSCTPCCTRLCCGLRCYTWRWREATQRRSARARTACGGPWRRCWRCTSEQGLTQVRSGRALSHGRSLRAGTRMLRRPAPLALAALPAPHTAPAFPPPGPCAVCEAELLALMWMLEAWGSCARTRCSDVLYSYLTNLYLIAPQVGASAWAALPPHLSARASARCAMPMLPCPTPPRRWQRPPAVRTARRARSSPQLLPCCNALQLASRMADNWEAEFRGLRRAMSICQVRHE